jgi:hypothetical protein
MAGHAPGKFLSAHALIAPAMPAQPFQRIQSQGKPVKRTAGAALMALALTACGGGSDSDPGAYDSVITA